MIDLTVKDRKRRIRLEALFQDTHCGKTILLQKNSTLNLFDNFCFQILSKFIINWALDNLIDVTVYIWGTVIHLGE